MRRIFRRRFMKIRVWAAAVLLVAVTMVAARMMQIGEAPEGVALILLRAANWAPAALLAVGLIWLIRQQWNAVAFFDVDLESGRYRTWLWRPVGWRLVEGDLAEITGWRYDTGRLPTIRAEIAGRDVALAFALRRGVRLDAAWRRIAPGAVAAYERDMATRR